MIKFATQVDSPLHTRDCMLRCTVIVKYTSFNKCHFSSCNVRNSGGNDTLELRHKLTLNLWLTTNHYWWPAWHMLRGYQLQIAMASVTQRCSVLAWPNNCRLCCQSSCLFVWCLTTLSAQIGYIVP